MLKYRADSDGLSKVLQGSMGTGVLRSLCPFNQLYIQIYIHFYT